MHIEQIQDNKVYLIRDFLSARECNQFIEESESMGYTEAPINTIFGAARITSVRNNTRVMVDDKKLAANLFERAREFLPEYLDFWELAGLNERLRYYRYESGERFAPHFDGAYQRHRDEISKLTFMLYLNDTFTGGTTRFYNDPNYTVKPTQGTALIFMHRKLHEGAPVILGKKYVLRTDVLYKRCG